MTLTEALDKLAAMPEYPIRSQHGNYIFENLPMRPWLEKEHVGLEMFLLQSLIRFMQTELRNDEHESYLYQFSLGTDEGEELKASVGNFETGDTGYGSSGSAALALAEAFLAVAE